MNYSVRVCNYQTALRLPEHLFKAYGGQLARFYDVVKHVSRADGRKLIGVADHNKAAARTKRPEQASHQERADHGHFVDYYRVAVKRIALVS